MSFKKLAAATVAAAVSIAATAAIAQDSNVPLIPRADIFGNPTQTQGRISPDGKWISWLAPRDGVLNIWVAPIHDLKSAKPLTAEKVRPIRQHFWAHNSKLILYINDSGGDENFLLYGVAPTGGEVKNFTPFKKTRVQQLGDSRRHPDEILIGLNNRDPQFHDVYRLNLVTGDLKMVYENHEFGGGIADEDLNLRFVLREKPGGATDLLRFDAGKTTPFTEIPAEDSITTNAIGLLPDGKTMYWIDSRGRDKAALVAQDVKTGATKVLAQDAKADIAGVMVNPITQVAEAYAANYLRNEWHPIGDAVRADVEALNRLSKGGQWSVASRNDADTLWVVAIDEVTKPLTYYLYDRKAKKLDKLFVTRPELEGKPLAPMHGVEIKARDGLVLPAFLTLPVGTSAGGLKPGKPLPMILNVHGGPWAQDVFGYNAEAQWMANRGYAVLQVNYRGSTGFGKKFVESATHEFAGKMHEDLIDAVKWAVESGVTTADKVAIYGGSYGGYATLVGMTFTPTTFACGVDIVGPSSLVSLIESFPEYWKPFMEGSWYRRVGNPANPKDREELLAKSPITRMAQIQRPLLIAQGANDPRVTKKESDQIVAAMVEKKIPVTYVVYGDEGHGFARPENRVSFYAISEAFLSRCLGGRAEPFTTFPGANITVPQGADVVPGLAQAVPPNEDGMSARTVITGGGGFIGSRLARTLRAADPSREIVLLDVAFPPDIAKDFTCVAGDVASPEVIAKAMSPDTSSIYHLAAVVSGGAEADFDLGYHVNMEGTHALLEAARKLGTVPRVVYASSVAAFGGKLPDILDDSTTPAPQTSYGTQKVIGEYLVADYTRKGFIDGRSMRLPTVVVRPGKANLAASSFASGIIREPLAGVVSECPVPDTTGVWILSPRRVVEAFIHAHDLPATAWPTTRVVNLPGITLSVREMIDAMGRVAGKAAVDRVKFVPDARIQGIVKTWPVRFRTERALAMGFQADGDFDSIVRDHMALGR